MPRVSVIIPSFNCADFVAAAVESVLAQSIDDCEVVVVDDGSTDDTQITLQPYLSNPRFRRVYQRNRGLPGARNSGVRLSDSKYVAFLDADDQLRPDALRLMTEKLDEARSAWCLVDIFKRKPGGDEIRRTQIPQGDLYYGILQDDFIRRGMFLRRDAFLFVGMYDEAMKYREDWDLNIRMFAARMPYSYIAEPLYLYTWREGSITTSKRARVLDFTRMLLRKHHKTLADAGDQRVARMYSQLMWGLARNYFYEARDYRSALRCALESLNYDFSMTRLLHPMLHHLQRLSTGQSASSGI